MVSPEVHLSSFQILTVMKVELGIKAASNVVAATGCSLSQESSCGIMYRLP